MAITALRYLILTLLALNFTHAYGHEYVSSKPFVSGEPAFAKNSWYIEANQNRPLLHTNNRFLPGKPTYMVGFRYFYDPNWIMGVSLGFRSLHENTPEQTELSYFSFGHETLRVIRLYHPTYLLVGARFSYMMPATKSSLPISRYSKYETEVGAGLVVMLSHHLGRRFSLHVRTDRWRGTKTNELHALETAAGLTYRMH